MPDKIPPIGSDEFAEYMRKHFSGIVDMLREMVSEEDFRENCVFMMGTKIKGKNDMMMVDMRGQISVGIEMMAYMLHSMAQCMEDKGSKDNNGEPIKKDDALKVLLYTLLKRAEKTTPVILTGLEN